MMTKDQQSDLASAAERYKLTAIQLRDAEIEHDRARIAFYSLMDTIAKERV